jgi:hypothetical protein
MWIGVGVERLSMGQCVYEEVLAEFGREWVWLTDFC